MDMLMRARVLSLLLGACAILNLAALLYPKIILGPKAIHAIFLVYALFGATLFHWIWKVGSHDPVRGERLFLRSIFAYWAFPFLAASILVFVLR